MRALDELICHREPAIDLMRQWVDEAEVDCRILPPSEEREAVLLALQVTTRSPLGALAYETGGVLVDHGWLRFLGSGHANLKRSLASWNLGRADGFLLVADDLAGGFFALNGGQFGEISGQVYYWPPDGLEWENLKLGFSEFFAWSLTPRLHDFYASLRWPSWEVDVERMQGDRCMSFYPFLWTSEGSLEHSLRRSVPVEEAYDMKCEIVRALQR